MTVRAVTNFPGGIVSRGRTGVQSQASAVLSMRATFDPTSSAQVLLGYLPSGSRVTDVVSEGGATGGTNPTVDIGTAGTTDGFANELRADLVRSAVAAATAGTLLGTLLTVPTPVYGKVGASAATGGTTTVRICYTVEPA